MSPIELPLTRKQAEFVSDLSPWSAMVTGYGGGKTHTLCTKSLYKGWLNAPCMQIFGEPTFKQVRHVAIPAFDKILTRANLSHRMSFNINGAYADFNINGRSWRTLFVSYDKPDNLSAFTVSDLFCDEADAIRNDNIWRQLTSRVRDPAAEYLQRNFATTPENFGGLIHTNFEIDPIPGSNLVRASTLDNIFAHPDAIKAELAKYKTEQERKRYLDGHYILPHGRVYTQFDRDRHIKPWRPSDAGQWVMCCDFGKAVMAWSFGQVIDDRVHIFDELVATDTDTITESKNAAQKWVKILREATGRKYHPYEAARQVIAYGDPAGGERYKNSISDFRALEEQGFATAYRRKHRRVNDRILSVNHKLAANELFFDEKRAPYVTRCISQQPYGQDGTPLKGRPHEGLRGLDHGADGLGYFVDFEYQISGVAG